VTQDDIRLALKKALSKSHYYSIVKMRYFFLKFVINKEGSTISSALLLAQSKNEIAIDFSVGELNSLFQYLNNTKHNLVGTQTVSGDYLISFMYGFRIITPDTIFLDKDESSEMKNYEATKSIILKPNFKYAPVVGKSFNASIIP